MVHKFYVSAGEERFCFSTAHRQVHTFRTSRSYMDIKYARWATGTLALTLGWCKDSYAPHTTAKSQAIEIKHLCNALKRLKSMHENFWKFPTLLHSTAVQWSWWPSVKASLFWLVLVLAIWSMWPVALFFFRSPALFLVYLRPCFLLLATMGAKRTRPFDYSIFAHSAFLVKYIYGIYRIIKMIQSLNS